VNESISIVIVVSGLVSGAIIGVTIATHTERKVRRSGGMTLFSNSNGLGVILNSVLTLFLVAVLFITVAVVILWLGGAYPLSQLDKYTLATSVLVGAAVAKWLRFLYWRRHA